MPEMDILNLKKSTITQLLSSIRIYANPTADVRIQFIGIDGGQPGEISIADKGVRIPHWNQTSSDILKILREELGIVCIVNVDAEHTGDAYAWVECRQGEVRLWKSVAPWYLEWYLASGLADEEIHTCLSELLQWQKRADPDVYFRGENAFYPDVRSGFARKWNTEDPKTLQLIAQHSLTLAKRFARSEGLEEEDEGLWATIQHREGCTGKIDFSTNIWVATYFASDGREIDDGRVWALQCKPKKGKLIVSDGQLAVDPTARRRAANQSGILVESPSGKIDPKYLTQITKIPGSIKPKMIEFLRMIGIEKSSLFSDLDNFIKEGQDTISLEALVHLWLSEIRRGHWERVLQETEGYLSRPDRHPLNKTAALYCCSLAAFKGGQIDIAWKLINKVKADFRGRKIPDIVEQNFSIIQVAFRSRDTSRLGRRIDTHAFSELWAFELQGCYKIKATPTPEQAKRIADQWQAMVLPNGKPLGP